MVALGAGIGEVGSDVTLLDPALCKGNRKTKRIQKARIQIYSKGRFEILRIFRDVDDSYLVHLNVPINRMIIVPAKLLAEVD